LKSPLSLFAFAVAIAAWREGLIAGVIATATGAVVSFYFFFEPRFTWRFENWGDVVLLFLFTGIGTIVSFLAEKVHRTNRELSNTKEQLELSYEAANEAMYEWDVERRIATWSPTYTRLFGRKKESESSIDWWFSRIHPDDRERVTTSFDGTLNGTARLWECQYRFQKTDGTWANVFDRALFVRSENGKAVRIIGAKLDITELYVSRHHLWMLSGLLPICAACKKIRDADGNWQGLETYIDGHSNVRFTHGMCPECAVKWYGNETEGTEHMDHGPRDVR
jgi:PAS domain S-box-containing protein